MPLYATAGSGGGNDDRYLHPCEDGLYAATCIDVIDCGMVEQEWDGEKSTKHMCQLRFWAGQRSADGDPLWVTTRRMTVSIHPKANLGKTLTQWRGRAFTEEEAARFDLETLLGAPAYLSLSHGTSAKGRTFCGIDAIVRLPKSATAPGLLPDYVRVNERDTSDHAVTGPTVEPKDARGRSASARAMDAAMESGVSAVDDTFQDEDLPF